VDRTGWNSMSQPHFPVRGKNERMSKMTLNMPKPPTASASGTKIFIGWKSIAMRNTSMMKSMKCRGTIFDWPTRA